ncbi:MAG: glucose 1-dehydrogenase [Actinomycetota bacterium]|nr:glucose 1-dehydrogenase [Actinomycetota bacterium]
MGDGHVGALEGYGALVTGGGSGIGLASAIRLARDGAAVTICGRTQSRLEEGARAIEAGAPDAKVQWVVADVVDEDAVAAAVAKAAEPCGTLDVVLASAGGSDSIGPVHTLDTDAFRKTLDTNVVGTMLALKHSGPLMCRNGRGSFIAVSSLAASRAHPWFGAYGPAKAGIEMFVQQCALELGPSGVRVNAVAPGLVDTELVGAVVAGGPVLEDYLAQMPLGRVGTPEDIAEAVRYLAGPESGWVTGQTIRLDGGHSLGRGPDFSGFLEPVFGADGLRGVVAEEG